MRARNISTRLCTTRLGSRRSGNTRAKLSAKPRRRSALARSITPPFEVRRPPSKAAVTFLARMAGNEKGRIVSSVMAGVAFAVEGDGVGFATESYAASALYTTLASLSGALWRIRRARSGPHVDRGCYPIEAARRESGRLCFSARRGSVTSTLLAWIHGLDGDQMRWHRRPSRQSQEERPTV